jgi:hypothetical protein
MLYQVFFHPTTEDGKQFLPPLGSPVTFEKEQFLDHINSNLRQNLMKK